VSFTALRPSVEELVKVVKVVLAVAAARVGSSGSLVVSKTIAPAVVLSDGSEQATVLLLESISEVLGGSSDVVVDIKAVNTVGALVLGDA